MAHRIDVHHHLVAPRFVPSLREEGVLTPHLASIMNENDAIADMDKAGVTMAVNSATMPDHIAGEARRTYVRENNEYMARLAADYPGRFGLFAALPLPDIDATLKEIAYAFDTLKADGVHMITSYGDHWLGESAFAPVFDELNRRKAVIYTHPRAPSCCANTLPELNIRDSVIEFGTDTTRALTNYLFSGTAARCPDIRVIWSHGGGTMPFLAERFIRLEKMPRFQPFMPKGFAAEAAKFYYDTAQILHASPLLALKQLIPLQRICYGTDYPWRGSQECVAGLKETGIFTPGELAAIDANALPLLPRARAAG
ncbi:MAG TPA: amidohydrolase family protein [Stellaceae bacterium]|nr:amidohydrolase family protein [Stellaceae bacterium]